ncbi:MAG: molybdenum cofactor biosynthesis protein MoaE [Gemmatimonadales bacterium]
MTHLTREPIELSPLMAEVAAPERGGTAAFVGTVRDHHGGRAVLGLEYSAYEPMAEREAATIVEEAGARWPVAVAMRHRLGKLEIGEVAVAVAAAGGHRDEAFEACRYVIEEVKRRVPIWKLERYRDGTEAWVDPTRPGGVAGAEQAP